MDAEYEDIPRNGDERSTLLAFLEWQRGTLGRKCAGLEPDQLRLRSAEPSTLSLLGLVRHALGSHSAVEINRATPISRNDEAELPVSPVASPTR